MKISSYVDRASPSNVARNALQRWYFVPDYESLLVSDDGLAIQLVGDGVKLVGADELVRADGTRAELREGRPSESSVRRGLHAEVRRDCPQSSRLRTDCAT